MGSSLLLFFRFFKIKHPEFITSNVVINSRDIERIDLKKFMAKTMVQSASDIIDKIEGISNVEPMTFPFDVSIDYLREDEAKTPLSKEDALKNAKNVKDGQIKLPKVVG